MLFGHQNDDSQTTSVQPTDFVAPAQNPLAVDPISGSSLPVPPTAPVETTSNEPASILNQGPSPLSQTSTVEPPVTPAALPSAPEPPTPSFDEPLVDSMPQTATPDPVDTPDQTTPVTATASDPDLLSLKQRALSELEPLVSQLDQTPEEKFRTTMMLIQSTDNHGLLQAAYDIAQTIPDEKVRAQALLDVVNEINYFTQQKS